MERNKQVPRPKQAHTEETKCDEWLIYPDKPYAVRKLHVVASTKSKNVTSLAKDDR